MFHNFFSLWYSTEKVCVIFSKNMLSYLMILKECKQCTEIVLFCIYLFYYYPKIYFKKKVIYRGGSGL